MRISSYEHLDHLARGEDAKAMPSSSSNNSSGAQGGGNSSLYMTKNTSVENFMSLVSVTTICFRCIELYNHICACISMYESTR
jgi:hypothetical protein